MTYLSAHQQKLKDYLTNIPIFSQLEETSIKDLLKELEWVFLPGGEELFHQGDKADHLWIIISGRLRVFRENAENKEAIAEIGHGESVGEMALLTGERRSATVKAIRDTELATLSKKGFDQLIEKHPQAMIDLSRTVVKRLKNTIHQEKVSLGWGTFSLVSSSPSIDHGRLTQSLLRSLEKCGQPFHITIDQYQNFDGEQKEDSWLKWCNAKEQEHDYLIFETDPHHEQEPWTRHCIRQSDRVLLFIDASAKLEQLPEYVFDKMENPNAAQWELVFLHESQSIDYDIEPWLEKCTYAFHHHIRINNEADMDYLARMLSGKALGLVLGGGGARGFAHIGVIRAFQELNIPIDLIGGASMGALIAAQYAKGWDWKQMLAFNERVFAGPKSIWDYTLPMISLIRGKRFEAIGREIFGDTKIEEMPRPFYCVSSNLSRAKPMVHTKGRVRNWIWCSAAVPGLIPPRYIDNDLLVDGGVLNNLPVDVMHQWGRGPICAINVSPAKDATLIAQESVQMSPWRLLLNRLNPFTENIRIPSLFNIILRTITLTSQKTAEELRSQTEYYLQPPVESLTMLDWRLINQAAEIGYQYTMNYFKDLEKQGKKWPTHSKPQIKNNVS